MIFEIKNATGKTITLDGTSYANGAWVDIVPYIAFKGITYTRNDVDGPNAGRALSGLMVRDRVATKAKWEIMLLNAIRRDLAYAIMELVYPETFYVRTDMPSGVVTQYYCYSNNIPVTYELYSPQMERWSGVKIPIVEM